ncbi:uncharacterized protein YneR [Natronobacillus azotifigens]|uniref:HesB/YadR/YfhF family protein n=1 Tax=Natronobacillus azotifigens TaxID=472978 RepID=A0A9J6RG24_9BACI|nr:HesB/YadR/YfhF family protein [Natronobacillus azotifigens]MCZ0704374.1 HesB/YadR/YfhF family protein [Natronobacillus azotifigens]
MEISITQPAFKWLTEEMDVTNGDSIRFFVRYGGQGAQSGFSLGLSRNDVPFEPYSKTEMNGITFFVEKKDAWYFDERDLQVKYSRKKDEIEFIVE